MNNKNELLDEYRQVSNELENIRNQVIEFKNKTYEKMKSAQTDDEESSIFIEYKNQVDKFAQDKNMKKKYRTLKNRKDQIESILLSQSPQQNSNKSNDNVTFKLIESNQIMDDIDTLIKKYKKFVKIPIECKTMNSINISQPNDKKHISFKEKDEDEKQMKNLYNLINSLKMDIDI